MSDEKIVVQQIDLSDLWLRFRKSLRRFWPLLVILGLLFSGVQYYRASRSFTPIYEARARFSVSSGYSADDIFNSSYYDNYAAQQLAAAFPYMLNTDLMRDLVIQQLDKGYINGTITPSAVADTNMFVLTVSSTSAQDAYDILCAVIDCYPQVAVYMVDNPQMIVTQAPTVPTEPSNYFSWKTPVIKGLVMGVGLALGIIGVVALFSRTVSTVEQLKAIVNLPILAVLPRVTPKKRRSGKCTAITASSDRGLAEALRGFHLKVRKLLPEDQQKVVLVTSTLTGEGKTTVASNLALSLAQEGHKVVLLDADIRSQSVAQQLGVASTRWNLMACLEDPKRSVLDCLAFVPNSDLAYLSGASINKRHYSIDPKAMRQVLWELSSEFEYVIMDTSPCAVVADAAMLCHFASSVLYVVKPDYARQGQILDAVNGLYEKGAPLLGFVFNGVNRSYNHYGYGYKYGYGYQKYGKYGYSNKQKKHYPPTK